MFAKMTNFLRVLIRKLQLYLFPLLLLLLYLRLLLVQSIFHH
ncbi:Uncharacterised protein [Escherichia coli]|uniref:Uncharacterized protein n=1 Tax=Escherichia coli TaxID=562 RepID=A0A376PW13_ECOLX|nr:Uncharacterised protein [Escherichia coli]